MTIRPPSRRTFLILIGALVLLGFGAFLVFLQPTASQKQAPATRKLDQTLPERSGNPTLVGKPTSEQRNAERRDKLISILRKLRAQAGQREPDTQVLLSKLLDAELSLAQRLQAVRDLTQSPDHAAAMEAFMQILNGEEPFALQAEVLRALGEIGGNETRPLLESYLNDSETSLWIGAMQGLAALRDPQVFALFVDYLGDDRLPMEVRSEAAALMANIDPAEASAALTLAFSEVESDELAGGILEAMGTLPFADSKAFYEAVLHDPSLSPELQIQALESLAETGGEATPFLLDEAAQAQDPNLRSAAIESLSDAELQEPAIARLVELLATEQTPEVRSELYRTLALNSEQLDIQTLQNDLIPQFQTESAPLAQIELARVVVGKLQNDGDKTLVPGFDAQMVPRLGEIAETTNISFERLLALDTLVGAGTSGAMDELRHLANNTSPELATAAQKALDRLSPQ